MARLVIVVGAGAIVRRASVAKGVPAGHGIGVFGSTPEQGGERIDADNAKLAP